LKNPKKLNKENKQSPRETINFPINQVKNDSGEKERRRKVRNTGNINLPMAEQVRRRTFEELEK